MKLILTLAALALTASLAFSEEPKKPGEGRPGKGEGKGGFNPEEIFKRLDANSDGSISKDEYLAGPRAKQDPAKAGENFARIDKDKDNKLTKEEFTAGMAGRGKDRGKGDGKGAKDGEGKKPAEGGSK